MEQRLNILGIAGSLRKGSYNKAILRVAKELQPSDVDVEIFDLEGIPPFNQDQEKDPPTIVREFKSKIRSADALLIATPENNYTIPGVLTNAIAWASRPYGDNAFDDKPLAIMGASVGMLGTARAQYHLRQCCVFLNMHPLNRPEVMVPTVQDKIDDKGRLTDENTRKKIKDQVDALAAFTRRLRRGD